MPTAVAIRRALLNWYHQSKRDLPWRRTTDPYAIWISEAMLQQTRVAAVLPYYEKFLKLFPSVHHLAQATEQQVLQAWSGLGYYTRARNIHKAAKLISAASAFPNTHEAIRALPGIGDYTAAAIASIAFGLPHAAIDGNALRVLSRLTAEPADISSPETRKRLKTIATQCLDRKRPGDFNQAVMELGATICLPRSPECKRCPLARHCAAYQQDRPNEFPIKVRTVQRHHAAESLFYIERRGKVLFWQRDSTSKRLAGFWELPGTAQLQNPAAITKAAEFRHTIVNTTFKFTVIRASVQTIPPGLVWLSKDSLHEVPLSTTAKKALRCLDIGEPK